MDKKVLYSCERYVKSNIDVDITHSYSIMDTTQVS